MKQCLLESDGHVRSATKCEVVFRHLAQPRYLTCTVQMYRPLCFRAIVRNYGQQLQQYLSLTYQLLFKVHDLITPLTISVLLYTVLARVSRPGWLSCEVCKVVGGGLHEAGWLYCIFFYF